MSNTPNPNKKRRKVTRVIEFVKLKRDRASNVYTPKGHLPGADYERVRNANPHLHLPALADLPFVEAA